MGCCQVFLWSFPKAIAHAQKGISVILELSLAHTCSITRPEYCSLSHRRGLSTRYIRWDRCTLLLEHLGTGMSEKCILVYVLYVYIVLTKGQLLTCALLVKDVHVDIDKATVYQPPMESSH